jgi:hypothetical protein
MHCGKVDKNTEGWLLAKASKKHLAKASKKTPGEG